MISRKQAQDLAAEWIAAWNAHDLERILSHYSDDFEMSSPLIVERLGVASGALKGKDAVRAYWQQGLDARPPLRFELKDVLAGVDTVVIYYRSISRNRMVAEILRLGADSRIVSAAAAYSEPGA